MKTIAIFSVLASAALSLVAAEELKVEVTKAVECERKTEKGDLVSMHYRGTLADSGKQFDASMSCNELCTPTRTSTGQIPNQNF
jgi:FK506-binding protein 2